MLNTLTERSLEKEWLDAPDEKFSHAEYKHCMRVLSRINRFLNFYGDTARILSTLAPIADVLDVGCGDGDFIIRLSKQFPKMTFEGIDLSPAAIELANKKITKENINRLYFCVESMPIIHYRANEFDAVIANLTCHHMSDDEIIAFLKQAIKSTRKVVIINDLHRHSLAITLFKLIQPILFRNPIVKHDGIISIRRSFSADDWKRFLADAGAEHFQIQWRFPFRWRITIWKKP